MKKRFPQLLAVLLLIPILLAPLLVAPAPAKAAGELTDGFADAEIKAVWQRDDGNIAKTGSWIWGPGPFYTTYEASNGTPTGVHLVQYFDKGRLEVNDTSANRNSKWFVTSGLLVKEMVTGRIATGSEANDYEIREPATIPVVGDSGANAAPGYGSFAPLVSAGSPGDKGDAAVTQSLGANGLADLAGQAPAVNLAHFDAASGHNVAAPFWDFMQGQGPSGRSGFDWVYMLGLPLAEPVWVKANVGGAQTLVLVQLFERRVLTFTPSNATQWQVEMGNVGRHYYDWRYANLYPDTKTPATRTNYDVSATVNNDRSVDVVEHVRYTNTTHAGVTLNEIVLRTIYNHWSGAFTVRSATANGAATTTRWRDGVNMAVALNAPLKAGASDEFELRFTIKPRTFGGRHGYDAANDLLNLGDWLPTVVPYENGGWDQFPYGEHGDEGIGDVSDYTVTFTSPKAIVVAGTGVADTHEATKWVMDAPGVRDVAYTVSSKLLNPYADSSLRRTVGNFQILGYFLPAHRAAGNALLDTVASAMRWYSAQVGAYPYKVFTVSEMAHATQPEWDYAQEYPMMYLIQTDRAGTAPQPGTWSWYTPLHEVAHAWFYGTIGNNQLTDPWLDETGANVLALEYVRANRSDLYSAAYAAFAGPSNGWPVSSSLYSGFPSDDAYFNAIYDEGTTFVEQVRSKMGANAFWTAMRQYYNTFSLRRARTADLLDAWQRNSSVDLSALFNTYIAAR